MRIFSEKTNQEYKTVVECLEAERAYDEAILKEQEEKRKLESSRKERAAEVEAAYKSYRALLRDFCRDFGAFHMSLRSEDVEEPRRNVEESVETIKLSDILNSFFKNVES